MSQLTGTLKSILILSGVKGDTRRYRTFHPYEQLRLAGVDCALSHITDTQLPPKIARSSIVILHRVTYNSYVEELMQRIKNQGGLAISDVDDLVFDPAAFQWIDSPDFQDPIRARLYREDMRRNRTTLERSHAVLVSTQYLADQVEALGQLAWIQRNAFSLELLSISEEAYALREGAPGKVIIGYASGTPTHDRDFQIAKPALKHVLERYPQTELWLVGPLNPGVDWGRLADRIYHQKWIPWRKLPQLQANFDVNLAPLVMDNPFGKSKSEIKYVEAGLVHVPTIASPTTPYKYAIRSGDNGFLAAGEEEWIQALCQLVEDEHLRRSTGERAYQDILGRYHPAVRAAELITSLNQINEKVYDRPLWTQAPAVKRELSQDKNGQRPVIAGISEEDEQHPKLSQMALYNARYRGLRTLFMQVWIYFRRLVSAVIPYKKKA